MCEFLKVTLLSLLQGIAEFLPISSSGHLVLAKQVLGLEAQGMRLDVFLHLGTLVAVFAFYAAVVKRVVASRDWPYLARLALSAVPVGIVGLCFKDALEEAFASPRLVGVNLLVTGTVLILTRFCAKGTRDVSWLRAIFMGLAQTVAILPGISRSGMTLAAARAARIDPDRAAEFSFLMSAPPIAGAALLELLSSAGTAGADETAWGLTLYGAALAAAVGYAALALLVRTFRGERFWWFGPYCLAAGVWTLLA